MLNLLNANSFDTDKSKSYLNNYEKFFSSFRDEDTKLLELGVYKGGSILMWGEYFKNGTIVGLDINDPEIELPQNVYFEKGDQRNKKLLEDISKKYTKGGFDIIIDDASHYGNFTEAGFLICFRNLLKTGGIYVIEDWGTGYWEDWPDGKALELNRNHIIEKLRRPYKYTKDYEYPSKRSFVSHDTGMVGLGKQLIDELAIVDIKRSNKKAKSFESNINGLYFATGQIFIFKK